MPHKINLLDLRYLRELLTNINVVALFALLFHPNSGLGYTPNGQILAHPINQGEYSLVLDKIYTFVS